MFSRANGARPLTLVITVLAASLSAQDSRPTSLPTSAPTSQPATTRPSEQILQHDEKAIATLEAMYARLYRPRTSGLTDIRCRIAIVENAGGKTRDIGSFIYEWTPTKDRATELKGLQRAPVDVCTELVGTEWMAEAKKNHIRSRSATEIELRAPEWQKVRPVDRMIIAMDEKGLPLRQDIYTEAQGEPFQTTTFEFAPVRDKWVITRRIHRRGTIDAVNIYEHKEIDGVTILVKTTMRTPSSEIVVVYSEHLINKGLKLD